MSSFLEKVKDCNYTNILFTSSGNTLLISQMYTFLSIIYNFVRNDSSTYVSHQGFQVSV